MNQPNLTPETIARLSAVPFPTEYNWCARRLARLRCRMADALKLQDDVSYFNELPGYEITLRSGDKTLTISPDNAHALGSFEQDLLQYATKGIIAITNEILDCIADMQDPDGDHQTDLGATDVPARLEVLRLILSPEAFAAFTAPAPMCEPEARSIAMPVLAAVPAEKAA